MGLSEASPFLILSLTPKIREQEGGKVATQHQSGEGTQQQLRVRHTAPPLHQPPQEFVLQVAQANCQDMK